MEAPVGAFGFALAGKHPRAQLVLALEGEHARSVREATGHVLARDVPVEVAVVLGARQGDLRDGAVGQGFGRGRDGEGLAAHVVGVLPAAVGLRRFAEVGEGRSAVLERFVGHQFLDLGLEVVGGRRRVARARLCGRGAEVLDQAQPFGDVVLSGMVVADGGRNLGQVVHALGRDDARASPRFVGRGGSVEGGGFAALEQGSQALPQAIHAWVGELAGHRGDDGQVFIRSIEHVPVAAHLLADGSQCIFAATLLKLVQHDEVGDVEHLDLLQLRVRAEFRGHHVEGVVGHGRDGVTALADAAGLAEDEVEADRLRHLDGAVEVVGNFGARTATGQRAHEQVVVGQGVHADAVAQQGAAGALSRRVHAQQADFELGIVAHDAQHQFVQEAGFSSPTGAGESDDRNVALGRSGTGGFEVSTEGSVVGAF